MMMNKMQKTITRGAATLICLTATVGLLPAQVSVNSGDNSLPALQISLEQAIQIALDENPTIKIADLEIERQKYVRRETVGNHLPQIGVTGTYTRAVVKTEMGEGISFDPDNTVTAVASINLPLFAPAVYKTLRLNEEQMRAAVEAARGSKITLTNEVKKAYYNILLAEESLRVLKVSEDNIRRTVEETRNKYENGLASEYDFITADVQLSNLQPTIIQTRNSIEVTKKLLKMYMSLPLDMPIEVRGDLDSFADDIADYRSLGAEGVADNSDLRATDIQIEVLKRQLQVSKTQRMPSLGAFGNFTVSGRDPLSFGDLTGAGGGASSNSFFWTNPVSVGLTLSIPIFSGLTNTSREKQLKNNISQLQLQRDYLEESTTVQLRTAVNNLVTAEATMIANKQTISQAQRGYDISKTRYDAGMGTMLEVNSAELQLTQSKLNYTQAVYDYLSAQADYDKIIGKEE